MQPYNKILFELELRCDQQRQAERTDAKMKHAGPQLTQFQRTQVNTEPPAAEWLTISSATALASFSTTPFSASGPLTFSTVYRVFLNYFCSSFCTIFRISFISSTTCWKTTSELRTSSRLSQTLVRLVLACLSLLHLAMSSKKGPRVCSELGTCFFKSLRTRCPQHQKNP